MTVKAAKPITLHIEPGHIWQWGGVEGRCSSVHVSFTVTDNGKVSSYGNW
jgi:hypothetical protein